MYSYALGIVLNILELVLFITGAYYTGIALFSLFPQRRIPGEIPVYRYAVVIPAHNEEEVLPGLIRSIKSADYPKELVSIYLVADGCSDKTSEVARALGAIVLEKPISFCKGDALSYAFEYLKGFSFDCVAVFDADNIVDSRFFREMNEQLALGNTAVQGYIDSKNPNTSWISNAYSVWYYITNRVMQYGRYVLGLGCRIGGTGFVLTKNTLESVPWQTETIAEDAEYTCKLALNDIRVGYAKYAVVYDEKPVEFSESVRQRKRWAQGIRDVQGEYTSKFIRCGKLNALLGLWSDFLYPFTFIILLIFAVSGFGGIFATAAGRMALIFYIAASVLISVLGLIIDRKLNFKTVLNTFGFILYLISWIPVGLFGVSGRTKKNWYHTKHGNKNQK